MRMTVDGVRRNKSEGGMSTMRPPKRDKERYQDDLKYKTKRRNDEEPSQPPKKNKIKSERRTLHLTTKKKEKNLRRLKNYENKVSVTGQDDRSGAGEREREREGGGNMRVSDVEGGETSGPHLEGFQALSNLEKRIKRAVTDRAKLNNFPCKMI
ncbi:hypothetical protein RUM43_012846 [Polyplax serrata]|uniref:Uncharacterized protein n=1 Tax=Polyplax serrata TaxID=468196 RepID=A0AAN8S9Q8_POLSC